MWGTGQVHLTHSPITKTLELSTVFCRIRSSDFRSWVQHAQSWGLQKHGAALRTKRLDPQPVFPSTAPIYHSKPATDLTRRKESARQGPNQAKAFIRVALAAKESTWKAHEVRFPLLINIMQILQNPILKIHTHTHICIVVFIVCVSCSYLCNFAY